MSTKVCIGLPVCNGALYVRESLDSLLQQTYEDFRVVLLDDGSGDGSFEIIEGYAEFDERISIIRNETRSGLIAAWNRVASLAGELFDPTYFAWFSDHDWVDPDWLEKLLESHADHADLVLAHPKTSIVDPQGDAVLLESVALDTTRMSPLDALRLTTLGPFGAGDAIYGLFRYEHLRAIGFLPLEILPDRLVISELSLRGHIAYVPDTTRYRRNLSPANYSDVLVSRQMRSLFGPDQEQSRLPLLRHGTYFLRRFLEARCSDTELEVNVQGLIHAYMYLVRQYNKNSVQWERELGLVSEMDADLRPYLMLFEFLIAGKWIPLSDEASLKLKEYKALNKDLKRMVSRYRKEAREHKKRREIAESRLAIAPDGEET